MQLEYKYHERLQRILISTHLGKGQTASGDILFS